MPEPTEDLIGSVQDALGRVSLFQDLDPRELARLGPRFEQLEVARHELIVHDGEAMTGFYVIREGSVVVFRQTVGRPVQLLARLRRGDFFGELGIFGEGRHMASVRASERSRVLRIARQDLLDVFGDHPEIEHKLQLAAARRHLANVTTALEIGRRSEVRIHLGQPVRLEIADGSARPAVLENLSLNGLCLTGAPADWRPGRVVSFGLGLREGLLRLEGRVAWRRQETVGLAFEKLVANHDTIIQMAIRVALEMKDAGQPGVSTGAVDRQDLQTEQQADGEDNTE